MLDELKRWSEALASSTSMVSGDHLTPAAEAAGEMFRYLQEVVADRRQNPGSAIIDRLIAAGDKEDRVSHDELVSNLILFLFAGHETTTSLLANGMLRLLYYPSQLADLRTNLSDADLVRNAVQEMLRFDGALYISMRVALEDFTWRGKSIKIGDRVFLYQMSADRDPDVFVRADEFDIRRADAHKHVAFGYGIHFCLGAPLARLEAEIAFPAFLRRYQNVRLADHSIPWKNNLVLRGPTSLRLEISRD
jgi:cytochrome P450